MKKIIIGQLMLWLNVVIIIAGYLLVHKVTLPSEILGLIFFLGVCTSVANLGFSIAIQVDGYQKLGILPKM